MKFIIFLITGSILALDRKLLIRSFAGYIPAIFGGLFGAAILGIAAGLVFGISPVDIVLKYVCPIMGGGNGAGAVPLSQIYETVTGDAAANYYSFAITILTIANIFAILTAAVLKKIGEKKTSWTGDGTQLIRNGGDFATEDKAVKVSMKDLGGIVPDNVRAAAKKLQSFFTANLILIIMVGVGVDTNIIELAKAITLGNVVIALAIVIGAIIGSALVGYLVGFFPIDSAITAGLCMANRGGSGDLAVLGACDRMGLIAYAQLSSRLGGGIVLIIASILFGAFLK